jgi:hypothetical protein
VLPKEILERPAGSRIKLRSSREMAMAAGAVPAAVPFTLFPPAHSEGLGRIKGLIGL